MVAVRVELDVSRHQPIKIHGLFPRARLELAPLRKSTCCSGLRCIPLHHGGMDIIKARYRLVPTQFIGTKPRI